MPDRAGRSVAGCARCGAASGVGLWTAASISGGRVKSGTSYAAPFVTAAARLLQERADATPEDVAATLTAAARDLGAPGHDPVFGHGLLQVTGDCARDRPS